MTRIACSKCDKSFPSERIPFQCECGGNFDYVEFPRYSEELVDQTRFGMMKYSDLFGLDRDCDFVTLGEGNTALLPTTMDGHQVFCKMESHNPTGSYKDRGSAVLVNFLRSRGVEYAVEDSSGNAGASFAFFPANPETAEALRTLA